MLDQASETQHTHQCSHCGALYDVVSINKRWLGDHDERVVCECGWPLKDWIGFKAYIFTRRADAPAR